MRILILLLINFFIINVLSQSYKEEIATINKSYIGLTNFSASVQVKTFKSWDSDLLVNQKNALARKEDTKYYIEIDDVIILTTNDFSLMVNNISKTIQYSLIKNDTLYNKESFIPNLDTLLKKYDSISASYPNSDTSIYCFYTFKLPIVKTKMYIDNKTHLIYKLVYFYNSKTYSTDNRIEIEYNMSLNPVFNKDDFTIRNFLIKKGNEYKATDKYKNYKIFINLN